MQLSTVADYITQARTLLQDTVQVYRYSDDSLVEALNNAFLEVSKLRPDLLIDAKYKARMTNYQQVKDVDDLVPVFTAGNATDPVVISKAYRVPLLYYVCGFCQMRDMEDTQDSRAAAMMQRFTQMLLGV